MKLRLLSLALVLTIMSAFAFAPTSAKAAPKTTSGTAQLFDTAGNLLGTVSNLRATLNQATNTVNISGVFTDTAGNVTQFTTTLLQNSGSCEILRLELGPLDLNLLGLMVHLDRVELVITAQPGPGNLLGNLLCAVANLLNDGNPLTGLVGLLNNLFRHL